ncbi:hypothetical protein RDI58_010011 [Solanum bulbocastanum]|uniref:Uncharacterized protein n=1 Tax=Solanum bulbocastanum TaxID=147425 RepID=A0AAN8YFJ9_SOLBU
MEMLPQMRHIEGYSDKDGETNPLMKLHNCCLSNNSETNSRFERSECRTTPTTLVTLRPEVELFGYIFVCSSAAFIKKYIVPAASAEKRVDVPMSEKEAKKEGFRKYLEASGVLDALTKVLVALYEQNDKPSSALDWRN